MVCCMNQSQGHGGPKVAKMVTTGMLVVKRQMVNYDTTKTTRQYLNFNWTDF